MIRECEGLQCNGLPTYIQNRSLNRKPLLFFDGRTTLAECAETDKVEARLEKARLRGAPRLVFSGRLTAIKGVDDLAGDPGIADLTRMKGLLEDCIGCGCLSMEKCPLRNPEDRLARMGAGPRRLMKSNSRAK